MPDFKAYINILNSRDIEEDIYDAKLISVINMVYNGKFYLSDYGNMLPLM